MSNEETLNNVESESEKISRKVETDAAAQASDADVGAENIASDVEKVEDSGAADGKDEAVEVASKPNKTEDKKDKRKPESAKTVVDAQNSGGMSKIFKLVYYPVLAVFVLLMMIFSIIDGVYGYKPKAYSSSYYTEVNKHIDTLSSTSRSLMSQGGSSEASNYIFSTLSKFGFNPVDEKKSGDDEDIDKKDGIITTVTEWADVANVAAPTVTKMTSALDRSLQQKLDVSSYLVGAKITNVIAAVPSVKTRRGETSGAVIMTVRYDTRTDSVGAAENAAFVANVMQSLIELNPAAVELENDLVVVFTEDLDDAYGASAFMTAFDGLGDVVSRATVGINLDAYGNSGTLALTDASGAGLDYINSYSKVSGNAFNSSIVHGSIADGFKLGNAVASFGDIPAIQVAVVGGLDNSQSVLDTKGELSQSIVYQQAEFVKEYIETFAGKGAKASAESGKELVFFSYLDGGTVAYNSTASYVIGALILALVAATVTAIAIKKAFSVKKLFIALGVELLVIASTLVAMFGAYFLVTLMLTGFGVLPIHSIVSLRYFNVGIFIAAMVISLASAFGFTILYKKLFKVTASDTARGTAVLFGIVGALMSFAAPAYSYVVSWLGMLLTATLLVSACFKTMFKNRFGFGMDRLFLYAVPVAICMPLVMSALAMLTVLQPLYMLPVSMTLFTAMLGIAVPYLDRTKDLFDKVAKKLPMRTIRVQRTVTEKVEDRAKKGKFTEKTFKRIDKEKVAVNYKNYFGVSVIAVIGVVIALFSGGFGMDFGQTLTAPHTYYEAIYNDALVYEWETGSDGVTTQRIVVDDLSAYKYIRYAVTDLEWDGETSRYSKTVNYNVSDIIPKQPQITRSDKKYSISTFDGPRSSVTVTLPSARSVTRITIKNSRDDEFVYDFSGEQKIVLRLPYGFGDFTMDVEGGAPTLIEYEEQRPVASSGSDNALANVDEWNRVLQRYRDTRLVADLRGGIVLKRTFSL